MRRCCRNFFLNFLRRCPWQPLAATRADSRIPFGSAACPTLEGRGKSSGCLPLGFPATLRIAASSRSTHASVVLTGMTLTRSTASSVFLAASAISRERSSIPAELASRWTKSTSNSESVESTARIFLSSADLPPSPGSRTLASATAVPTTSAAPQCDNSRRRCGTSALSEVPSHRRRKRIKRSCTGIRPNRTASEAAHLQAAAGSPASSTIQEPGLRPRPLPAKYPPTGSTADHARMIRHGESSFPAQATHHWGFATAESRENALPG